ncbi:MAG TPA: hypothetical protein VK569_04660 [Bacteroidota bacterium]|nr:hypothetical protein [Bacteroidota bacterium]
MHTFRHRLPRTSRAGHFTHETADARSLPQERIPAARGTDRRSSFALKA